MAVASNVKFKMDFVGQPSDGSIPRLGRLECNNTLAEVVVAGYLNPFVASQGLTLYPSDFIFVSASDGNQIYKPVFGSNGVITLTVLP